MVGGSEGVREQIQALAAVLTAVRGRLVELSGGLPDEEPVAEGQEPRPGLRSLLSCVLTDSLDPAIRDLLRAAAQDASPAAYEAEGAAGGASASRLSRAIRNRLAEQECERGEAEQLFSELRALDGAQREAAIKDPRFHRESLVEKLLETSQDALPGDPARAEELATLAEAVAGRLADASEAAEARTRAACRLANARRLAGDHASAEQALSQATLWPGGAGEEAELCRAIALLRWEQGRTEEALALLDRAAGLWAEDEVTFDEGACQVLRALVVIEEGRASDAVGLLREALPLLADPWLTLYGGLALALGLAVRGLAEKARAVRDESLTLVHRTPPPAYLYALRLEGEIATSLGEHATAAALLDELRIEAMERQWLPEAAAATLALARLDVEHRIGGEPARARAAALAVVFAGFDGLDAVLVALRDFPDQLPAEESLRDLTGALTANLVRLLRLRGVRGAPLPFV